MFSRDQLKRAASLTEEDFVQLGKCRRPHNRIGFAYQVGFVRLFDRFPQQQPFELFEELVCFSAAQLRRRHETEFKARWVPLLPRESAKKTFNVVTDRCLNDMRCFRGGLTLSVLKIPFRVFSSCYRPELAPT